MQAEALSQNPEPLRHVGLGKRGGLGEVADFRVLQPSGDGVELSQRVCLRRRDRREGLVDGRPQSLVDGTGLRADRPGALDRLRDPDHLRHLRVVNLAQHIVDLVVNRLQVVDDLGHVLLYSRLGKDAAQHADGGRIRQERSAVLLGLKPPPNTEEAGDHEVVLVGVLLARHETVFLDESRGFLRQLDPAAGTVGDLGRLLRDVGTDRDVRLQGAKIELPRGGPLAYGLEEPFDRGRRTDDRQAIVVTYQLNFVGHRRISLFVVLMRAKMGRPRDTWTVSALWGGDMRRCSLRRLIRTRMGGRVA